MSCRCLEISILSKEINNLRQALVYVEKANKSKLNTIIQLSNAGMFYENGVVFDGSEAETIESLKEGYNKASSAINNAKITILNAINKAEDKLDFLRSEDKCYHDIDEQ